MGKLILCSGLRTKRPYVFHSTGIRIYSIEELCHYLYHHVYLIEDEIFTNELLDWIGMELKLTTRAEKLRQLKEQTSDLKTMVTFVMCSADYYTEKEIVVLLKTLDQIIGMSPMKRNCVKANHLLKDKQFIEAIEEFERILISEEAINLTPTEYGDILHNMAVAKVNIVGLKEAADIFCEAYERNRKEESLRQYLYAVRLSNNMDLFYQKVEEYGVNKALCDNILKEIDQIESEAGDSEIMPLIHLLKQSKTEGRIGEYYKSADAIIMLWKATVRQI